MIILCWNNPIGRYAKKMVSLKVRLYNQQISVPGFKAQRRISRSILNMS